MCDVLNLHFSTPPASRWLHLECERQSSGHAEIQPSQGYVCSSCRPTGSQPQHAPPQVEEEVVVPEKDTGGLELSPQTATQSHTDSQPVVLMHTDLEPGLKQLRSPPPVHNDPEPELQPVPMHTDTEPEPQPKPIQATAAVCENDHEERQPQQATSDQQPGKSFFFCLTRLFVSTHRGQLCVVVEHYFPLSFSFNALQRFGRWTH
jgi:hypothetical protein